MFDIDIDDEKVQKVIDFQMAKAWRTFKYKLHTHFTGLKEDEDPKENCPDEVTQEEWDYLCGRWADHAYKVLHIIMKISIILLSYFFFLSYLLVISLTRNEQRKMLRPGVKGNMTQRMDQGVPCATMLLVDLSWMLLRGI